ncbi:hypothetical protein [Salinivibrio proteolyticus]|uniref:Uncharacterized protein n=1 Tax=Salinivibrio proteolyticus TaxID=334715 RepID=A0ABY7LEU9_9GAMM|nr:hypothetical protein [Salinivibrio proteolyticus]WBA15753.1 hypothetical protein N7E60_05655 [Salinivibrio proteolyticus]
MFDELTKSLKSVLYERVSSPLLGSVGLVWLAYNWKPVFYFLLSDEIVEKRIDHIATNYTSFDHNFLYPVLIGGAISIFYPVISFFPFWVAEQIQHIQRNLKQKLSMSQLLTLEQSMALRAELVTKEKRIKSIVADSQTLRAELERQVKNLTDENTDLYHRLSELDIIDPDADPREVVLSSLEKKVLQSHTGMKDDYVQIAEDLASHLDENLDDVEIALNSLKRRKFLNESEYEADKYGYTLSKLGRKYLGYQKAQLAEKVPNNSMQSTADASTD